MRNKIFLNSIILFFSLFIVFISCGKQDAEWKGTIEVVDGVKVVKNPKEPMYEEDVFGLEEELTIGQTEGTPEYMFSGLRNFTVDDKGYVYALDYREKHVKLYDEKGEYIRTIGRAGEGPGEFGMPVLIGFTHENELFVLGISRVSFFTQGGDFIRSQNLTVSGVASFKYDKYGNSIAMQILLAEENPRFELGKFNSQYKKLLVFESSPISREASPVRKLFTSILRWDVINGERIVCGNAEDGYLFKIYDLNGNLISMISKAYNPSPVTKRDIEIEMEKGGFTSREQVSVPEYKPPFRWFYTDEEGRIFVSTWDTVSKSEGYYYDIFDAEGRYMLTAPIKGEPLVFKNGKLFIIFRDEEGYPYIKRYKVTWNI